MIQDHSDHGASKEPMKSTQDKDSSAALTHYDLSGVGSLIPKGTHSKTSKDNS